MESILDGEFHRKMCHKLTWYSSSSSVQSICGLYGTSTRFDSCVVWINEITCYHPSIYGQTLTKVHITLAIKLYKVVDFLILISVEEYKLNLAYFFIIAFKGDSLKVTYLPGQDRILFCDGHAVGIRKDLNGMLLLDTALQTSVCKIEDKTKIEISYPEVCIQNCRLGESNHTVVIL